MKKSDLFSAAAPEWNLPQLSSQGWEGTALSSLAHRVNNVQIKSYTVFRPISLTSVHHHVIRHSEGAVQGVSEHVTV